MSERHRRSNREMRYYVHVLLECGHHKRTWKWKKGFVTCMECEPSTRRRVTHVLRGQDRCFIDFAEWKASSYTPPRQR